MSAPLTFADKAKAAYQPVPDWVEELAMLADAEGLGGAAKRINYSKAVVSLIVSGTYRGDTARVEGHVRGALMGMVVECPILGVIGRDQCLTWQSLPFAATDATRLRVFRACRNKCVHAKAGVE